MSKSTQPADTAGTRTLIFHNQLDDYTTVDPNDCTCKHPATTSTLLTPCPKPTAALEVRCSDCGTIQSELYTMHAADFVDKREYKP